MTNKKAISVFIDFDGTITKRDTLQFLLDEFGREAWRPIEKRVDRGELVEAKALQMEMDLVDASMEEALRSIDGNIEIDSHFMEFMEWCRQNKIRTTIVSGGFRRFIRRVLLEEASGGIEVLANEIDIKDGRWVVVPLGKWEDCRQCNHCKRTAVLGAGRAGDTTVYIGNGNTDICPARSADVVIARDRLAAAMRDEGRKHYEFDDFLDVKNHLIEVLQRMSTNCTNSE